MKGFKKCPNCGILFKGRVGPACTARCAFLFIEYKHSPTKLLEAASTMGFEVGDAFDDQYEVVRIKYNGWLQIHELLIKLKGVDLTKVDEKILTKWDRSK